MAFGTRSCEVTCRWFSTPVGSFGSCNHSLLEMKGPTRSCDWATVCAFVIDLLQVLEEPATSMEEEEI